MSRLTEKNIKSGIYYPLETEPTYDDCKTICIQKLGKLEDIEDEMGCSLEVLSKAIHNGVWAKNSRQGIHFISHITWLCEVSEIKRFGETTAKLTPFYGFNVWKGNNQDEDDTMYRIEDYGKTWALTKEELEK